MAIKENSRWRPSGINGDHRPGAGGCGFGGMKKADLAPRRPSGVPMAIWRYIETGEGARPATNHVEPDGFKTAVLDPGRRRCTTEGCTNLLHNSARATLCGSCVTASNAIKTKRRKRIELTNA